MSRIHPAARLALLGLAVAALFAAIFFSGPLSSARVRGWIGGSDPGAAALFVALSALLTVACFPGPLLAGACGLLFGAAVGTPLSILAATLGAVLAFLIARLVAGDAVARLGGDRLQGLSRWVGERGFVSILYARILPGVPYTAVNYAAGLSPVRLRAFTAATAIGVAPRAFAYTALGGSLGNLGSPEAIVAVGVLVVMAVGGLLFARAAGSAAGSSCRGDRSATPP
ncbi:MAG: TVP38/TMEM64 family protein [Solirubrobacteraceae bacterium]